MLPIPARSCQRAISTIPDARASERHSQLPHARRKTVSLQAVGAAASLIACVYLCNVAETQTRLVLLLQEWSTQLCSGNVAAMSNMVAVAPFCIGLLFVATCCRALGVSLPGPRQRR